MERNGLVATTRRLREAAALIYSKPAFDLIDAYNEATVVGRKFLAKEHLSQSGEKLILRKCIDFYHSKELDQLARRYANKK